MEKIKDALNKAKIQRKNSRVRHSSVIRNYSINKFLTAEDDLSSIVYSTTKIVDLDPIHLESKRIFTQNNIDPSGLAFDSLRTQVLQKMEENNWRTIAIVSPTPASGKTVVSINLAISIAKLPHKTALLVDFDLRRPSVSRYLGLKQDKSLNDFISQNATIPEILVNPSIPRLTILPTNKPVKQSSETLSSKTIQNLVIELKERYDSRIVLFDLPPILNADDAMVLIPQVDCVLLVMGDGMHSESEITQTMRLLTKTNILGVVINKSEEDARSYYY